MSAFICGLDVHKESTYATILNPEEKTVKCTRYYTAVLTKSEIGKMESFPFGERLYSYARLVSSTYASRNRPAWHHQGI